MRKAQLSTLKIITSKKVAVWFLSAKGINEDIKYKAHWSQLEEYATFRTYFINFFATMVNGKICGNGRLLIYIPDKEVRGGLWPNPYA
jgi:hypothetical protein